MRLFLIMLLLVAPLAALPDNSLLVSVPLDGSAADHGHWQLTARSRGIEPGPDRFGKSLGAVRFGAGSWVELTPSDKLNGMEEFTLSAWICPQTHREHNSVISKVTPSRDFNLQLNVEGRLVAHINSGRYEFAYSERKLPLNQWTHVAATFQQRTWKLYVNGILDSTHKVEQIPVWRGQYLTIGNIYPNGPEGFLGSLDDVRVYNRALGLEQIKSLAR